MPDVAVLLVGAGLYAADSAAFRARLASAGLLDAVVDVGWTAREQLPATLAAADVGLYLMDDTLLNRTKCPVKLADMLAAGVPVVAEAVGQVVEYVRDGRTGVLVASGDVAAPAATAAALLADAGERARRSAAARADVATRFGWERLAEEVEGPFYRGAARANPLTGAWSRRLDGANSTQKRPEAEGASPFEDHDESQFYRVAGRRTPGAGP